MQTVGIIGGSGFIGSYITKIFLEEGFKVKISSTDINNKSKYEHLYSLTNAANIEILPLDISSEKLLNEFVSNCDILVHAGTPFILEFKDAHKEIFEPTVTGTQNFLNVIKNSKSLKKVVLIASVAAWNTSFPLTPTHYPANHLFSEQDTPYMSEQDHPYAQAKFLANMEVSKYINEHSNLPFEIVSLSPTWVVGNALSQRKDSTSAGMQFLIKNKIAEDPFVQMLFATDAMFSMIDVRDVAEAVFQAATTFGLHGKNYLIANESYTVSDISRMLNNEPPIAEPIIVYDSSLAKTDLGIAFISIKETLNHCI
ncbi:MAG: NAD-dependent epimerase/dehydratase family protein [Bacteroidetes bacterium]|nr:NAD-dependent epimerase/dehydratase family protein [Bacteroidota bacterium]MBS1757087.1 NAD-dependent epimerase/dehydratase family protein [Bacteroidota bacterium]